MFAALPLNWSVLAIQKRFDPFGGIFFLGKTISIVFLCRKIDWNKSDRRSWVGSQRLLSGLNKQIKLFTKEQKSSSITCSWANLSIKTNIFMPKVAWTKTLHQTFCRCCFDRILSHCPPRYRGDTRFICDRWSLVLSRHLSSEGVSRHYFLLDFFILYTV